MRGVRVWASKDPHKADDGKLYRNLVIDIDGYRGVVGLEEGSDLTKILEKVSSALCLALGAEMHHE